MSITKSLQFWLVILGLLSVGYGMTKFYQHKSVQQQTAEFFEAKDSPKEISNSEFFDNLDDNEKK